MRNNLKISSSGEDLISCTDDGTNRLYINGNEIASSNWTGTGNYTTTVNGHLVTIAKVTDATGNVAIRKTGTYTYELYKIKSAVVDILDIVYPVGSIYMSVNNADPASFIGGTWERIKDTFLLSAGDTYSAGSTGGEAEVKLDRTHYQYGIWSPMSPDGANYDLSFTATSTGYGIRANTNSNTNDAHNNMPPYLAVYVWKRVS